MIYGYARVSTDGQTLDGQLEQLEAAGCTKIFREKMSGANRNRPQLQKLLRVIEEGDMLVVARLDRLARSLADLVHIMAKIETAGVEFRSLGEAIDTSTPAGRAMMQMVGVFAEFERRIINERTKAGREAARRRGVHLGRKPKLSSHQRTEALQRLQNGDTAADIARTMGVHRTTISRLQQNKEAA